MKPLKQLLDEGFQPVAKEGFEHYMFKRKGNGEVEVMQECPYQDKYFLFFKGQEENLTVFRV